MNLDRGRIHTPYLAAQLRDFSGLRYGKITPTDIDAVLDFGGRLFVFIEAKLVGAALPRGQELALERLTDCYADKGMFALCIVCEHENRTGQINLALCSVTRYRWQAAWRTPASAITVKSSIDRILLQCGLTEFFKGENE